MDIQATGEGLPENAYRELKKGETYVPIVPTDQAVRQMTVRSVLIGIIMAVLFSGAAAFLGLKIAQVFEAAIPIAILAIGIGAIPRRKSTILENVIIQSIGGASGLVVAGAIFTLPALFILGLDHLTDFIQFFIVSVLGGVIGIMLLIPLRRYFVADMHGKYPFPEATAITEVLVAGEKGGKQARVLAVAAIIGGIYDFLAMSLHAWAETFTTSVIPVLSTLTNKVKMVFSLNTGAAVMGLGYIVGLRYAVIIACGSFLSWFIFIPLVAHLGSFIAVPVPPAEGGTLISGMSAGQIFATYVRYIGIGGIFAAGIIGIIKSSKIIWAGLTKGISGVIKSRHAHEGEKVERTNLDIKMVSVMLSMVIAVVFMFFFYRYSVMVGQADPWRISIIATAVVFVISFLFTTVAAQAIAIVGINPVSGMTLMTLILTSILLIAAGLSGPYGMLAALLVGGVVCTALSMVGGAITDFKTGYWIGATPRAQQYSKLIGTIFAAATVGIVIVILNKVYGFVPSPEHPNPLPAPQANAMAAVIKTLMTQSVVPWLLYGVGAILAVLMNFLGISPLAFALGMYIPLSLNTPILVGALVAHFVAGSAKGNEKLAGKRRERGTLIASGFIAGGALMGVLGAVLSYISSETGIKILPSFHFGEGYWPNWLSLGVFIVLCIYLYLDARRAKE